MIDMPLLKNAQKVLDRAKAAGKSKTSATDYTDFHEFVLKICVNP
jgi:hypothetical protein